MAILIGVSALAQSTVSGKVTDNAGEPLVGYGTARRRDLSGSIASVNYANDKNISTLPNPNALAALSSKVAGFSYAPTSSASGDNTGTMTIRGKSSIPSSVGASSQSVNQPMPRLTSRSSRDSPTRSLFRDSTTLPAAMCSTTLNFGSTPTTLPTWTTLPNTTATLKVHLQ